MSKVRLVLAAAIFAGCFCAEMAEGEGLVKFPPGPAAWTVNVVPSPSANPAFASAPRLVKVDVKQDGEKRCSTLTSSNGTYEQWNLTKQNAVMVEAPDGSVAITHGNGAFDVYVVPFTESTFEWLKPKLLVEKDPVSYQGKMCLHYRSSHLEAWIEEKTLLPVASDDGIEFGTYTFDLKATPSLTFSPKFQAAYARLQPR